MDSVRVSPSFSPTPSLNDVTPSMGMSLKNNHIALQQRMPDPSNLNVLNQHLVQQPMSSGGSRIFISTQIETRDELDEKHDRCYNIVMGLISGKSAKEAIDSLTTAVGKDTRAHDDVCIGLIIGTLTSSPQAEGDASATRFLRDLTLICRDGLTHVLSHLSHLVLEKYSKLMPLAKQQLLWIIRELVRSSVAGMDSVVWNLMRQIAGGDVSRNNLWLADSLLDLFTDHRSWLDKFSFLVASVAYTYLRLIEDHAAPQLEKLREKEVKFVVPLIRDRFADVMVIGRDLVRVLQYVAKLPEMSDLWRDLLFNPKNVAPGYTGLSQLMETRTSRRFLQSRITPEMEKKLVFLTSQVL
jgi:integrator complex subunit 3